MIKTSKPNLVTFFVYFGNRLLDYFFRNLASLVSLAWRNWRWISE